MDSVRTRSFIVRWLPSNGAAGMLGLTQPLFVAVDTCRKLGKEAGRGSKTRSALEGAREENEERLQPGRPAGFTSNEEIPVTVESSGGDKSLLVRSCEALALMRHHQQMTLQMNICAPYWADCPISFQRRWPHVKGPGDSQSAKHARSHP